MPKFYKESLLSKQQSQPSEGNYEEDEEESDPIKVWAQWEAPSRPFRKKNRSFYTTIIIIIALISMISLLAGQYLLIGVLLAFLFLIYILNFVEPETITYKITTQGVTIGNHFYHWNELDSFWFDTKDNHKLLHILTNLNFPGVLVLVLGSVDEEQLKQEIANYLPYHEIAPKTTLDKWSDSLQKHFPLEKPQ